MDDEDVRVVDAHADVHNFASSSPQQQHRLPTISGIEALEKGTVRARGISTGLPSLDPVLLPGGLLRATPGVQRGYVTEVYGPPGVGKTTFGLQVAVNALCSEDDYPHVLWVDTGSPLVEERLLELMEGHSASDKASHADLGSLLEARFSHLQVLGLPRLLTLFLHPPTGVVSPQTCLIVVDDLSNLVLGSFSRTTPKNVVGHAGVVKEKMEKRAVNRRFRVIETLAAAMSKMAALRNVAVLVLTNAAVSLRSSGGSGRRSGAAYLKPALSSQAWDTAVHTRVMLYRDFADDDEQEAQLEALGGGAAGLRYADVQRLGRSEFFHARPVPFTILTSGLCELGRQQPRSDGAPKEVDDDEHEDDNKPDETERLVTAVDLPLLPDELSEQPSHLKKRKAVEIADSEDDEDDLLPAPEWDNGPDGPDDPGKPTLQENEEQDETIAAPHHKDEMLLDAHEIAVLRSHRYASIRGSEDAIRLPSSSSLSDAEDEDEALEDGDHDSAAEGYEKDEPV